MDAVQKIEKLDLKREELEQQLKQKGISEAKDIAIRHQIIALGNEITSLNPAAFPPLEPVGWQTYAASCAMVVPAIWWCAKFYTRYHQKCGKRFTPTARWWLECASLLPEQSSANSVMTALPIAAGISAGTHQRYNQAAAVRSTINARTGLPEGEDAPWGSSH
jgi:hypothetical protein